MGEREVRELSAKGEEMKRAMFHLKELSREEGLRLVEEAREKAWKDQMARESDSFNRGVEEGMKQAMVKWEQDLVLNMLKEKVDVSLISKITGLSEEKINELENQFNK